MTGWQKNMTLVRVLAEQGKSAHEIGELINVTQNTVQRYAKAEGIQLAPSINVGKKEKKIYCKTPTPEKLALAERYKAMYIAGKTLHEIGVEEGVSRERIRQILSVIGVDRSLSGYSARVKSRKEAKLQEKIEETVRKKGLTPEQWKAASKSGMSAAYTRQRNSANQRGIGWEFNLGSWLKVWEDSGFIEQRGTGKNKYAMCRKNDLGPYSAENVEIKTNSENGREASKQWIGKVKENRGVHEVYKGSTRPFLVIVKHKHLGRFATALEAVKARDAYIRENKIIIGQREGFGRGWTFVARNKKKPYYMQITGYKPKSFATQEEAEAEYQRLKALKEVS